jgi:hypothetical protein
MARMVTRKAHSKLKAQFDQLQASAASVATDLRDKIRDNEQLRRSLASEGEKVNDLRDVVIVSVAGMRTVANALHAQSEAKNVERTIISLARDTELSLSRGAAQSFNGAQDQTKL